MKKKQPSENGKAQKPARPKKQPPPPPPPAPPSEPFLLPSTLERMADLCTDQSKFALGGIHLSGAAGRFRAEATDGKVALIVQGTSVIAMIGANLPLRSFYLLKDAPNGAKETIIPGDTWRAAMRGSQRVGCVAIKASDRLVSLSSGEGLWQDEPLEARFPCLDQVFPKQKPVGRATVRIRQLLTLLRTVESVSPFEEEQSVMLLFYGEQLPLGVVRANRDGLAMDGLIMPVPKEAALGQQGCPPVSGAERQRARAKKR